MLIVYVGAVAVLFLFVVMMLNVNIKETTLEKVKEFRGVKPIGILVGVVIFLELIVVIGGWKFKENVLVKHVDNKLNGENLDLSFQNNLMLMYNNIIYQNSDTKLLADKLEIDLITKDSKIIMNDKKSKIKIIRKK